MHAPVLALGIVLVAALSDFLDGLLARAIGKASALGAVLDPIADKTFVLTALGLLWGEGVIHGLSAWAVLIILWREILIAGFRDYVRSEGLLASVSPLAKLKTAAQFSAVIVLFVSRIPSWNPGWLVDTGTGFLWASAGLALYSGGDYLARAWRGSWK